MENNTDYIPTKTVPLAQWEALVESHISLIAALIDQCKANSEISYDNIMILVHKAQNLQRQIGGGK